MTAEDFAELVSDVRRSGAGFTACCPHHKDQHRSLTFADGQKALVVKCHAGCTIEEICAALGVPMRDLFPDGTNGAGPRSAGRRIVETYDYRDVDGRSLYQAVRYEPKDFRQRRPDGSGGWIWNLEGVPRVLYRLPDLQGRDEVVLVEGEKDADRLWSLDLPATTNAMGAGKWQEAYSEQLRQAGCERAVLLGDNDHAGVAHMQTVGRSLSAHGVAVRLLQLPDFPPVRNKHGEDVSDWLDAGHAAETLRALIAEAPVFTSAGASDRATDESEPTAYIETLATFLAEADAPLRVIFPELLPCGVILLLHGEPRARKSLAAFELALAAATGTAPFGLTRFTPAAPLPVLYVQEEDPRQLTRARLRRLVAARCAATVPDTLHVAVRRGIDLDDPQWVERLIGDLTRLGIRLLILDAARRLSTKTDEGPAKVRELIAAFRALVTRAGVSVVVVHHDIKPPRDGQDLRRRGQRASGGDWFAACECPVHIERVNERESLVYPQDYKFSADPAPFTFSCLLDGRLISRLVGRDTTTDRAETAGLRGKLLEWLRSNGPASKTAMKKAGFRWETITALIDGLLRDGAVDATPGRTAKSNLYFVTSEPSPESGNGSPRARDDAG